MKRLLFFKWIIGIPLLFGVAACHDYNGSQYDANFGGAIMTEDAPSVSGLPAAECDPPNTSVEAKDVVRPRREASEPPRLFAQFPSTCQLIAKLELASIYQGLMGEIDDRPEDLMEIREMILEVPDVIRERIKRIELCAQFERIPSPRNTLPFKNIIIKLTAADSFSSQEYNTINSFFEAVVKDGRDSFVRKSETELMGQPITVMADKWEFYSTLLSAEHIIFATPPYMTEYLNAYLSGKENLLANSAVMKQFSYMDSRDFQAALLINTNQIEREFLPMKGFILKSGFTGEHLGANMGIDFSHTVDGQVDIYILDQPKADIQLSLFVGIRLLQELDRNFMIRSIVNSLSTSDSEGQSTDCESEKNMMRDENSQKLPDSKR